MPRILCIEDEQHLREDLVEVLKESGYDVLEASNGIEGIATITRHRPDIVISDVTMPGKTGFEVISELHQDHPGGSAKHHPGQATR